MSALLFPPAQSNLDGVQVSGTPGIGQILTATSGSAASWKSPFLAASQYAPTNQVELQTTSATMVALNVAATTVAAGSNGGEISTIATWSSPSAGVLDVAATTGWPTSGTVTVAASGATTAVVTYTGITAGSLTGCAYVSGSATGTVATGGAVTNTGISVNTGNFTAPSTGNVLVSALVVLECSSSSQAMAFGLALHGTTTMVGYSVQGKPGTLVGFPSEMTFLVTGLVSGNTYNFDLMFCAQGGASAEVYAFGQTSSSPTLGNSGIGSPVVMTVQAV